MNSRLQQAHQQMWSHKERPSGLTHQVLRLEDQRHKNLVIDQDNQTSIPSDLFTNLANIFLQPMGLTLTQFKMVTEQQASLTEKTRIKSRLVKV